MKNRITQALEDGARKLGTTLGDDAGKAVKDLYHGTGNRLKKVAENHAENDAKHASEMEKILKGGGKDDMPRDPHATGGGGRGGNHGGGGGQPKGGARDQTDDLHPNNSTRPPQSVNSGGSDPVDMASGRMFLPQTDLVLPGALPLVFGRRVESGYRVGRWFGPSWSSTADQRLELDERGVVLVTEDGLLLSYPHPEPGGEPVLPVSGPRRPLTCTAEGEWAVHDPDTGHTRHFTAAVHDRGLALLDEISDRNGNWITFDHDADTGAPTAIRHHAGHRLTLTTEDGRVTALHLGGQEIRRYAYTDGNLTAVTDPSGGSLRLTYDEQARVTSWTDSNDRRYEYAYDALGRCVSEGGEAGHITLRFAYDDIDPATGHRVTTVTNAAGHTTRYLINDRLQVVAETDALGNTTRTPHDEHDRLTAVIDPFGRTTSFAYDEQGRITAVTRPDGLRATATYNDLGLPATVTDPDGTTWHQEYDARGNRIALTAPGGVVTRYGYDDRGRPVSVTDALGRTSGIRCDAAGLPIAFTDALGAVTTLERDAFGEVVSVTDPLGATTRVVRDGEGRVTARIDPDGARRFWTYDGEGNCVTHTDAMGGVTTFEYGHFDVLCARTTPDGVRHAFEHDAQLRLTRVTDPAGLTWDYAYDPLGRLTTETDFDGRTLSYTHDATGQLTTRTDAQGQVIRLTYDVLGNVVERDAEGQVTTYAYDPGCRLVRAANADAVLEYARDETGRLLSETHNGRTLSFTHDILDRRTSRTTPSGAVTTWEYDAAGQIERMTTAGRAFRFTRDAGGRETARSLGGGCEITQSWDALGRLTAQRLTGPGARLLQQREYTYRPDGHLTGVDDPAQGSLRHTLDAMGRVTGVNARDWSESYAYDAAGNQSEAQWPDGLPMTESRGERRYTGTRISTAGNVRYEHDALGRMTLRQRKRLSRAPETWTFQWDVDDRLTRVTTPDGETWTYLYDPLGRRIAKRRLTADGGIAEETTFTWDGATLAEQTTTRADGAPAVSIAWDYNGLRPIAQTEYKADQDQEEIDRRFFAIVTDLVGAPTELVDESGEISWRARTTLWGTTTWNLDSTAYTPLRFPGQYFDAESGLHYNFHRYYDPGTGRYLSPDPLGLSPAPNPVTYVDNPHRMTDPLGLAPYVNLYHGTNKAGADAIIKNGIDPTYSKRNMDFGTGGFYTTNNRTQAEKWAKRIAGKDGEPAVLHYRVDQAELDKLNNKKFDANSGESLDDWLYKSRKGENKNHGYDSVEGPMLLNLKDFMNWKPSVLGGHQIAIYTPKAASVFNSGLQGTI
ncbi:RHS repeat-associated core domain-containing protein [Streptomyces sp. NPDC059373]